LPNRSLTSRGRFDQQAAKGSIILRASGETRLLKVKKIKKGHEFTFGFHIRTPPENVRE
jgi:hypothetical protein